MLGNTLAALRILSVVGISLTLNLILTSSLWTGAFYRFSHCLAYRIGHNYF